MEIWAVVLALAGSSTVRSAIESWRTVGVGAGVGIGVGAGVGVGVTVVVLEEAKANPVGGVR